MFGSLLNKQPENIITPEFNYSIRQTREAAKFTLIPIVHIARKIIVAN